MAKRIMICCMPFTYLSNAHIETLTATFGSLLIYHPMAGLVPDHMRTWSQRGLLDLRLPAGVDVAKLRQVINDFTSWADLYRGDTGDLSAGLRFSQQGPPLVDETAPSQISTQIRRYGQSASAPLADSLFQACLFLALAHDYDQHQDAMRQEMRSVHAVEQRMFTQIIGNASDRRAHPDERVLRSQAIAEDPGQYMTGQRIHAWATLALTDAHLPGVYLTTSPAVFEHLQEAFPKANHLLQRQINAGEHIGQEHRANIRPPCRQMFEALILAEDPATVALGACGAEGPRITSLRLTLNLLTRCRPRDLLGRLLEEKQHIEMPPRTEQEPINTLIALVEFH